MTIALSMTRANRLARDQKFSDAAAIYGDILAKFPKNTKARKALNDLRKQISQAENPGIEVQKGLVRDYESGQYGQVAANCASLLNSHRRSHFLWEILGNCHLKNGHLDEAATCLNKACELNPKAPSSFAALADVYRAQGDMNNAIALYEKSLSLDPDLLPSLNNLARVLSDLNRMPEALPLLEKAVTLAPNNPTLLYNYGNALRKSGDMTRAKALLEKATELAPQLVEAQYNLAQMQSLDGDKEQAIERFEAVLVKNPGDDRTRSDKLHAQAQLNDWRWIDEYQAHRRHLGLTGTACAPFTALTFEDNPDLLRLRTQAYANEIMPAPKAATRQTPCPDGLRPDRLRIGYFSSDFHDHATMRLMAGLFEAHDQTRFHITAYSYDGAPADATRSRVMKSVSQFKDLSAASDQAVLDLVKSDELDIAVDLKGFTGDSRSRLFSDRLAPVQISYLGFPGTLGSSAFDYLIGDHVTCPAGSERYYEEHLIRMPHSYQVNDNTRKLSSQQFTRKDCGLPQDGFVFCSFNNSYKITPREFDIWMRLLAQVDGSVLWLLDTSETSKANLRREAQARGIDAERLIFAPRAAQPEHLARHQVADLFLDTFVVNAHTTASDALWAGLPVLTLPGRQFAARVGASLLQAVGMPELIATSEADYEARALNLAQDLDALAKLRGKLHRNRQTAPLFDTKGFTRDLEQAFDMSFEHHLRGRAPVHLNVSEGPTCNSKLPNPAHLPLLRRGGMGIAQQI